MESFDDLYNINLYDNTELFIASYNATKKLIKNKNNDDDDDDNNNDDDNKNNEFKKYMFKNTRLNNNEMNYKIMTEDQITIHVNEIQILHNDFWNVKSIYNKKYIDKNGQRKPLMMIGETYLQIKKCTEKCYNIKTIFTVKKFSKEICEGKYSFVKEIKLNRECLKKSIISSKYNNDDTKKFEQTLYWLWYLDKQFPNILSVGISAYPINFELYEINNCKNNVISYFDKFLIVNISEENKISLQGEFSFENVYMKRDEFTLIMDNYVNTTI